MKRALGLLSYISTATLAKVALGVVISVIVLARIAHEQAAEAFQLLLLQSAMITLISASAYPRGVSVDDDMRGAAGLIIALLVASVLVGAITLLASSILSGTRYWPSSTAGTLLALLWMGAVATGLHTLLQGIFLKANGPRATFLPLTAAQLSAAALIAFADAERAEALIRLIVAAQCFPLLLFAIVNYRSIARLDWSGAAGEPASISRHLRETVSFGATASSYLVVILMVREAWRETVDSSTAAYVFFSMRLSEVYMQIAFYLFASARSGGGLGALGETKEALAIRARMPLLIAVAVVLAVLVVTALFAIKSSIWLAILAILAQGAVDLVRLPVSSYFVQAIQDGRPALYAFIVLPPLMILVLAFVVLDDVLPAATMFYCQIAFAGSVALLSIIGARLLPRPNSQAGPPAAPQL